MSDELAAFLSGVLDDEVTGIGEQGNEEIHGFE